LKAKPVKLKSVGVIGAGLMGGGIAMASAEAGLDVTIIDVSQASLDKGMSVINANYQRSVQRKSMTAAQAQAAYGRIRPSLNYGDLSNADLVVEAVFENMKVKKQIFGQLDNVCKKGCVLSSNTSGLNIDEIANATSRPEDVVGCHFFSPANVMKLLENVKGSKSSPVAIATVMKFGSMIGKVPVLVGNCPGFVGNRMINHYSGAARQIMMIGGMPSTIDGAAERFGMRMGPIRMSDLVGIDLFGRERAKSGAADTGKNIDDWLFAEGRYGMKTGKGYYVYDEKRKPQRDPAVEAKILEISKTMGMKRRDIPDEEVQSMLFLGLINEGIKILEEGIATRPSDIDVVYVYGYNFPKFKGGPMYYADTLGLDKVLAGLNDLQIKPANLLKELVAKKMSLAQWGKANERKLHAPSKL